MADGGPAGGVSGDAARADAGGPARPAGAARIVAGRYRLAGVLGRGGMGTVWRAVDEMLHRDVAIKELRLPEHLDDEEREIQQQRTLREARTAARITHENVVTIHDVVEDGGIPWIVMELVEAESLADVLKNRGTLAPAEAAEVGLKVLGALMAAEEKGVLHRDVKPANILVTLQGRVVLTDFGIATETGAQTLTATGMLIGSPNFLAPERAQGLRPNLAADLWSLGLVMYMAVEGRNPFDRPTMISTLNSILLEEPDPPRRAGVLLPVIHGLLQKDPAQRLPAKEVERLLTGIVRGDQTQAHRGAVPPTEANSAVPPAGSIPAAESAHGMAPGVGAGTATVHGAAFAVGNSPTVTGPSAGSDSGPGSYAGTYPGSNPGSNPGSGPGSHPGSHSAGTPWPAAGYGPTYGQGYPAGPAAPAGPYPTGPHTLQASGPAAPPARASRKPMALGITALVIALIAAGVAVTFVLRGGDDDKANPPVNAAATDGVQVSGQPGDRPSGSPSASGGPSAIVPPPGATTPPATTGAPAPVPGYTWTRDPAGFSLFVPNGWTRSQSGAQIDYVDPRSKTFLRIGIDNGGVRPLDNLTAIDADFKKKKQDYRTLQLASYPIGRPGWEAAVWEFTWLGNPFDPQGGNLKPSHAIDVGMRTDKGTDFSVYVASFDPDWSSSRKVFDTVLANFREG
ncbi:serine/threonine-protein kinase [Yinghuangia soli]|uniref:non-specific serine/threonine protein kinase n=1 Tax=Yinghuangia soli TaxID=2908204 RepID=A0AA41Q328_9ACTN|nr:serine/threonine-protein kinase [Yinghuangia soli]MCF2530075.1 protein kinase [Yinghuangia soli]